MGAPSIARREVVSGFVVPSDARRSSRRVFTKTFNIPDTMNPVTHLDLIHRRQFFQRAGFGAGSVALASLLRGSLFAAPTNPLGSKRPMFAPRAKRVIFLHMIGAPSQLDLFDHKPELNKLDGQDCPESLLKGRRFAFIGGKMQLAGTKFKFARHGRSGQELSVVLATRSS